MYQSGNKRRRGIFQKQAFTVRANGIVSLGSPLRAEGTDHMPGETHAKGKTHAGGLGCICLLAVAHGKQGQQYAPGLRHIERIKVARLGDVHHLPAAFAYTGA